MAVHNKKLVYNGIKIVSTMEKIVRENIEKNKYGKAAKHNHSYLLKGKIFCGCCDRRMSSYTGSTRPTKVICYYSCVRNSISSNRTSIRKEILE